MKKLKQIIRRAITTTALGISLLSPNLSGAQTSGMFKPFPGACYGPFRTGQSPNLGIYPTVSQIAEDLPIIKNFCYEIRTYGNENNLSHIPKECKNVGLKCYAGAWVDNATADTQQINSLIQIGNLGYTTTAGLVVGNEYLYRHPGNFSKLTNWISQVRTETSNKVKVGAAEQWHIWRDYPQLANSVDFMMVHVHPYWENQSIENAANFVKEKYDYIHGLYPTKPIIIGETGWPTAGAIRGLAVPSTNNQERFIRELTAIAKKNNMNFMIFEIFNERWKETAEGTVGRSWGVLNENREIKKSLENVIKEGTEIDSIGRTNLSFTSYESSNYILEKNPSLSTSNWVAIKTFTGSPATNITMINFPASSSNSGFYRIDFKYR